jgi:hypothetical protein
MGYEPLSVEEPLDSPLAVLSDLSLLFYTSVQTVDASTSLCRFA